MSTHLSILQSVFLSIHPSVCPTTRPYVGSQNKQKVQRALKTVYIRAPGYPRRMGPGWRPVKETAGSPPAPDFAHNRLEGIRAGDSRLLHAESCSRADQTIIPASGNDAFTRLLSFSQNFFISALRLNRKDIFCFFGVSI